MSITKPGQFPLEEEYKKDTGITPEDIQQLRDWLKTQPHLPEQHITDLDLILTYHCCNRSSAVAKQVLDLNLTLRTLFTNILKERHVDDATVRSLNICLFTLLEMPTHKGQMAFYGRLLDYDPKNFHFATEIKGALMTIDVWQYKTGTWPGFILLIDLDKMALGHLTKLDIQTMQQFLYYLQEAMLVKLEGLHFLNAPSFMDKLMMLIKPFLKKALLDVLHIHQIGSRTLEDFLPMSGLPNGAGGDYKSFEELRDEAIACFKANQDYFEEENKKRVTESKRPGKPKTISDIFGGVEGSFKKLDID